MSGRVFTNHQDYSGKTVIRQVFVPDNVELDIEFCFPSSSWGCEFREMGYGKWVKQFDGCYHRTLVNES